MNDTCSITNYGYCKTIYSNNLVVTIKFRFKYSTQAVFVDGSNHGVHLITLKITPSVTAEAEASATLSLKPNAKHLKEHIQKKYGKFLTLRDIYNMRVKVQQIKTRSVWCSKCTRYPFCHTWERSAYQWRCYSRWRR